jgi:hypothetical protein
MLNVDDTLHLDLLTATCNFHTSPKYHPQSKKGLLLRARNEIKRLREENERLRKENCDMKTSNISQNKSPSAARKEIGV